MHLLFTVLNWGEIWGVIIPIIIWLKKKPSYIFIKPIITYFFIALALTAIGNISYFVDFNNNFLYNTISIIRLFLFVWFFYLINIPSNKKIYFILLCIFICLVISNFIFLDSFTNFSSKIFTLEGIVLLSYCVFYFLKKLKADDSKTNFDAVLYIVTALAIYEAICFPIFLFFDILIKKAKGYAIYIWDVHNIVYIVFCLFIARAFYGSSRRAVK